MRNSYRLPEFFAAFFTKRVGDRRTH
jgi:hypothetical protein